MSLVGGIGTLRALLRIADADCGGVGGGREGKSLHDGGGKPGAGRLDLGGPLSKQLEVDFDAVCRVAAKQGWDAAGPNPNVREDLAKLLFSFREPGHGNLLISTRHREPSLRVGSCLGDRAGGVGSRRRPRRFLLAPHRTGGLRTPGFGILGSG